MRRVLVVTVRVVMSRVVLVRLMRLGGLLGRLARRRRRRGHLHRASVQLRIRGNRQRGPARVAGGGDGGGTLEDLRQVSSRDAKL